MKWKEKKAMQFIYFHEYLRQSVYVSSDNTLREYFLVDKYSSTFFSTNTHLNRNEERWEESAVA